MDDTYLREFTDDKLRSMKADKPKTPVPYNEWIKCMVGKFLTKQSEITQNRMNMDSTKDNARIIKEENAINAENELNFCKKKGCRKSEGVGYMFSQK